MGESLHRSSDWPRCSKCLRPVAWPTSIVKLYISALCEIHYVSLCLSVFLLDFNQSGPTVRLLACEQNVFMLSYFRDDAYPVVVLHWCFRSPVVPKRSVFCRVEAPKLHSALNRFLTLTRGDRNSRLTSCQCLHLLCVSQHQFQPGRLPHLRVQRPRHGAHLCCRGPQKKQTVKVCLCETAASIFRHRADRNVWIWFFFFFSNQKSFQAKSPDFLFFIFSAAVIKQSRGKWEPPLAPVRLWNCRCSTEL